MKKNLSLPSKGTREKFPLQKLIKKNSGIPKGYRNSGTYKQFGKKKKKNEEMKYLASGFWKYKNTIVNIKKEPK